MRWIRLLTSTIQFLCISIPEPLLHVTRKGRAEISADIFALLLPYFNLSCNNKFDNNRAHLFSKHGCRSEWHLLSALSAVECRPLLHVTRKGRAEISADIFALLLPYFNLSCNNKFDNNRAHLFFKTWL